MQKKRAFDYAKELLAIKSIVFFEVRVEDGEDPVGLAQQIVQLGCSVVVDAKHRVIKVFARNTMPKGFGYL